MKLTIIYLSVAILLSALIALLVINQQYKEQLSVQGDAVRQLVVAALSYPSGSVMEWPTDVPTLVKFYDGELDKVATTLDMGKLVYPRPDAQSYAIQPAIIYSTMGFIGNRYIVGYCNGDVKITSDSKFYTVGKTLEMRLIHGKDISLKDWQEFIPDMVRR